MKNHILNLFPFIPLFFIYSFNGILRGFGYLKWSKLDGVFLIFFYALFVLMIIEVLSYLFLLQKENLIHTFFKKMIRSIFIYTFFIAIAVSLYSYIGEKDFYYISIILSIISSFTAYPFNHEILVKIFSNDVIGQNTKKANQ